jgi:hypothetical protein
MFERWILRRVVCGAPVEVGAESWPVASECVIVRETLRQTRNSRQSLLPRPQAGWGQASSDRSRRGFAHSQSERHFANVTIEQAGRSERFGRARTKPFRGPGCR